MGSAAVGEIIGITVLMFFWLSLVVITFLFGYKRYKQSEGELKKQLFFLILGLGIIFIGDLLHTIGLDISRALDDPTGTITIFGGSFAFQSFALFFDNFAFVLYYALWEGFIVSRYKNGKLELLDKIIVALIAITLISILFAPFYDLPNKNYTVLLYAIHNISFIIFGLLVVISLLLNSRSKLRQDNTDKDEKSLYFAAIGYIFSFVFFVLTLALLPLNSKFGMMMIPKTFAYAFSLISLDRGIFKINK